MEPLVSGMQDLDLHVASDELCELVRKAGVQAMPPQEVDDHVVYIGAVEGGKRRVLVLTQNQLPFTGSQDAQFYKAFACRFAADGTAQKVKEVVAISLPNDELAQERVKLMQTLACKDLFPKNYGFFTTAEEQLIFQELATGDLVHMTEKKVALHKLSFENKRAIARKLLQAACHLRQHKIVHRDIKAENVLVCGDLDVKLTDFGHAHLLDNQKAAARQCGTVHTLAPELVRRYFLNEQQPQIGFATDIWSVALIIASLCNEFVPFHEAHLYNYGDLLDKRTDLSEAKKILEKESPTREESDKVTSSMRKYKISLSPKAPRQVRLAKVVEQLGTLNVKMAKALDDWQKEIAALPKRPREIRCLQDLVTCMLQEAPETRMGPEEALSILETLTG